MQTRRSGVNATGASQAMVRGDRTEGGERRTPFRAETHLRPTGTPSDTTDRRPLVAVDALDPGPDGDYPYWPRDDSAGTHMPTGRHLQPGPDGKPVVVDLTPTGPDGQPIQPPPSLSVAPSVASAWLFARARRPARSPIPPRPAPSRARFVSTAMTSVC